MEKAKLEKFKKMLLDEKSKIMNSGVLKNTEDLHISTDDLAEDGDLANTVINQQVKFSLRERELVKLHQIEEALERIEDGTYGHCEDCDEPIGEKRLAVQPWTTLCIEHAEERERDQTWFKKVA